MTIPATKHTILQSLFWKFFERCSVQVVSFIVTIILARLLTPQEYGAIALVLVFISTANVIVEGGLNTALIQKKKADQLDFSTIFYASLAIATILYIILFLLSPEIAKFYNNSSLESVVKVLGISLYFSAANSIQKAFLSRNLLFKNLFYSSFGAIIISGIFGICLALKGFGIWALVTQTILTQASTTFIMGVTVKWRPTLEFSWRRFCDLFNYGWKIFLSNMLVNLSINIRSLFIGKVYSSDALALFDRGKHFPALIIENINSSIQSVIFPVLSSIQDDKSSVKSMVRRSIKMSTFIIFPLVITMAVLAEPLIITLLTEKWIGAAPYIRIFCIAYLLMPMQIANLEAIKSLGYSGTTLKIELVKKLLELIILIITIPISVQMIAFGIVVYNFITLLINIQPNKKILNYGLLEQIKDIMPTLIISILMGGIVYTITLIPIAPPWMLTIGIMCGVFAYWGLAVFSKNESYEYAKQTITEKLKHKIKK